MSEKTYDAIVLGAGPAGEVVAGRLADAGWKLAIAETDLVGGECSYYACMPSKALLRPADVLAEAKRVPGVPADDDAELDPAAVLERRDKVIHGRGRLRPAALARRTEDRPSSRRGALHRRGTDRRRRRRAGRPRAIVIATGSGAAMPPIDGLDSVPTWNNRDATTADEVPASMIVLGGGPVGVGAVPGLGVLGTQLDPDRHGRPPARSRRTLRRRRSGDGAARPLRRRRADRRPDRPRCARAAPGSWSSWRAAAPSTPSELLVAVGRTPHTDGIGLDPARGRARRARLRRGRRPRCGSAGTDALFAIGDVNGRAALHPRRQVPGLDRRREPPRPRGPGDSRKDRLAAGHLHRSAGRRGRQDAGRGRSGGDRRPHGRGAHRRLARRQLPGQGHRREIAADRRPGAPT